MHVPWWREICGQWVRAVPQDLFGGVRKIYWVKTSLLCQAAVAQRLGSSAEGVGHDTAVDIERFDTWLCGTK